MEKEKTKKKSKAKLKSSKKSKAVSVSPVADMSTDNETTETEKEVLATTLTVENIPASQKKHVSIASNAPTEKSSKSFLTINTEYTTTESEMSMDESLKTDETAPKRKKTLKKKSRKASSVSTPGENTEDAIAAENEMSNDESIKTDENAPLKRKKTLRKKSLSRKASSISTRGNKLLKKMGKDEKDETHERQIDKFFVMKIPVQNEEIQDQEVLSTTPPPLPKSPRKKSIKKVPKILISTAQSSLDSFETSIMLTPMTEVSEKRQPKVPKKTKSSRFKTYEHFVKSDRIFQNGYGSSVSSDSDVSPDSNDDEHRPDMTWILHDEDQELDLTQVCERSQNMKHIDHHRNEFFDSLQIILWTLKLLGRIPFVIYVDDETGTLHCRMYTGVKKIAFILINILLSLILLSSLLSVLSILFKSSVDSTDVENFEKLLLEKHWLHMIHFQCFLLLAVIEAVAESRSHKFEHYINNWGLSLQSLKYDASNGIRLFGYMNLIATVIDILIFYPLVYTKSCGRDESNKFITVLIFRWVIPDPNAYYSNFVQNYLHHLVLFIQLYVVFAARSTLCFVLSYCRGITNVAHHWNLRIALMLHKLVPTKERPDLIVLKKSLTYRKMLEDHFTITKLVRRTSNSFMVIFVAFFCIQIITVVCEMFKLATVFIFDLSTKKKFNSTVVQNSDVKYDSTHEEIMFEILYFVTSTVILFTVVSLITSSVGETIMGGFHSVRRYGLMCAKGMKERKFIMSLTQSFNGKNPYVLNPGSLINIDRSIVVSVLGAACLIFSIMIQCKVVNLVQVTILLPCTNNGNQLCASNENRNQAGEPPFDPIITDKPLPTIGPTTTGKTTGKTTTTTTTEPPIPDPECTPADTSINPDKWTAKDAHIDLKKADCGRYCKKTGIYRIVPRNDKGDLEDVSWIGKDDEKEIWNCIVKPYAKIPPNKKVYDCMGNCFKERDDCGHYTFNLGEYPLQLHTVDQKATGGFKGVCYTPVRAADKKLAHPLEICSLPFPIVNDVCTNKAPKELKDLFTKHLDLIWDPSLIKAPIIPTCNDTTSDKDLKDSNIYSYEVRLRGNSGAIEMRKLKTYTYMNNPSGDEIPPLQLDDANHYLHNGYAYIYPKLLQNSATKNLLSFGMYDCFGNPLKIFDDCGGLSFKKLPLQNSTGPKNYKCFVNAYSPDRYKCGGLSASMPDDIELICDKWQRNAFN